MEVINFKTKHEIGQTVYVHLGNGDIREVCIIGILFTNDGYQYRVWQTGLDIYRKEEALFDTVEEAIKDAVREYTFIKAEQYKADLAKI